MKTLTIILLVLLSVPSWAGKEYDEAVKLIKAKKYGVAKTLLGAVLKNEDSPKVRYAMGFCCEKAGDKEKAVEHYRVAVAQNLNDASDPDEAARALKKLMEMKPEVASVLDAAMDLESKAKKEKSEFLKDAARKLYDHALDPDNWNLKAGAVPVVKVPVKAAIPKSAKEYKGNRYQVYEGQLTWDEARRKCESLGGHLVCIGSKGELKFVKSLAGKTYVWLGGRRQKGVWSWVDRHRVLQRDWGKNHPAAAMDYMAMRPKANGGEWVSQPLVSDAPVMGYVCEWEK